ncbi:DNA damage-regulated autophagy modulator protein 1-like [Babylonia areolata]|uniref:DNA damage-regulated autophagy modulator protein 1-like n=1 Tax=Babylonia areolata TaxID=304850 RepID=UPI003FD4F8AC
MEEQQRLNVQDGRDRENGCGNQTAAEGVEKKDKMALCILFLKRRVHYLPVLTAIFIIASLFIAYGVSVSHGHVEPDFPYISYTAIQVPERCIFAQLINIGAFLMGANVYVRFLQQREQYRAHGNRKDRRLAIASLVCGWLSAFGLSMVANFQTIVMRPPHYVGAGLAFGMGVAYCWLQTSISLRHRPRDCITLTQLTISILLSLFLVIFGISKAIFKIKEKRGEGTKEGELRGVYLVSTISEWLTVVAVVVFALSFYSDFTTLTLHGPRVRISQDTASSQQRSAPRTADNVELTEVTCQGSNGSPRD